jgi:long-chain acyl-CoA synthetase
MITTIFERFDSVATKNASRTFVADIVDGQIHRQSYSEIVDKVHRLASAFQSFGLTKGDRVAILLPNSADWVIADLACAQLGLIGVPIHTTYSWNYINFTIQHSGSSVFCIDSKHWNEHQQQILTLGLKKIIVRGAVDVMAPAITWQSCLEVAPLEEGVPNSPEDVHTIVYTSGTTADPKGVMLTHDNILSNADAARQVIPIFDTDSFFSFLPLSHMLERTGCYYTALSVGASIYFASGTEKIAEEVMLVRPTIMLSVPRMFDKMHHKIFDTIDSGPIWKKKLFFAALKSKHGTKSPWAWLYELLVFRTIKAKLGGRLRFVISGGASLDRKTARFFQTIGLNIFEGYGLTETSPVVAVNSFGKTKIGTVGLLLPGVEVTIDKEKQILIRGRNVMKGYYQNDEITNEVIDSEGWFHSGDMGFIDSEGYLTVTGRIKELIVLTNGKKVNPVPIEISLNRSKYISQAMVHGDGQNHLSAIIVLDFTELNLWLQAKSLQIPHAEAIKRPEVRALIAEEIRQLLKEYNDIEQVTDFILIAEEFTQENDMVTPTQKLKRRHILELYSQFIDKKHI